MGFSERFPRWTSAIIGLAQLALTAAIVGLEVGSVYIDLAHGTIWVGFWAGVIFIKTLLLMLFITCCCRGRCCATYVLIWTILSGALACVMIYFDQIFINDLCKCYLGDQLCCAVRGIESYRANFSAIFDECGQAITQGTISSKICPSIPYAKLKLIKAQLGCAVGMLITCAIYVVIYLFACLGICFGHD
ncbi:unnamed protein product [Rotaria magnacalcarata]|uniref:Uncharacterized protein n=3 Tax=Rotaria magnacalcarata TaxID=392030 RepID=A0A820EL04_9BILA|nr:unnamed protein product [Rotaria magnacalcarata]CAF1011604.1 unnamed protein product [Rotaria magnacalcarata]CAF1515279.1 unnamed protein product [Rotaria magnacalcarata]CAF2140689.1 unnamed protein product [Rotaria magnacalcarata]CAF2161582.1 unnamed protein product [Rotaria magnacalcarata]